MRQYSVHFIYSIMALLLLVTIEWLIYIAACSNVHAPSWAWIKGTQQLNVCALGILLIVLGVAFLKKFEANFYAIKIRQSALISICFLIALMLTGSYVAFLPMTPHSLINPELKAFDAFFGIDSMGIFRYVSKHAPALMNACFHVYYFLEKAAVLTVVALPLFNFKEAKRLLQIYLISLLLVIPFYYFFPSFGPVILDDDHHNILAQIVKSAYLATRVQHVVHGSAVVAFPSYHVMIAFLMAYGWRQVPIMRIYAALYAIALCISVIVVAEHYFADVLGAMAFFALSLGILILFERQYKYGCIPRICYKTQLA